MQAGWGCGCPSADGGAWRSHSLSHRPHRRLCPPAPQLPLLDKAAHRLLTGAGFEDLRAQMAAWRAANDWVEQSALFRCGQAVFPLHATAALAPTARSCVGRVLPAEPAWAAGVAALRCQNKGGRRRSPVTPNFLPATPQRADRAA